MDKKGAAPVDWPNDGGAWLEQLHARLKAFFRRGGSTMTDAEDLAQDVLLRLVSPGRTANQQTDAYAFTIARNLQRDRARRSVVRRQHDWSADRDIYSLIHPDCDDLDAERVLISKEDVTRLIEGLAELGERRRAIFLLHRLEGRTQREIADQFGVSISAVEKNIAKAMLHLMEKVGW